jgi:hypothetical protein
LHVKVSLLLYNNICSWWNYNFTWSFKAIIICWFILK